MSEAWRVASITSFEQVPVGAGVELLRIAAESTVDAADGARPMLVADDGYIVSRFVAVPAPPDREGPLRSAYSVSADLVTAETVFSLEFDDGFVIALPHPASAEARVRPVVVEPEPDEFAMDDLLTADDPYASALAAAGPDALDLLVEVAQARAELQAMRELAALGGGAPSGVDAGSASIETDQRVAHAERQIAEAERRIADAVTRADSATLELAAERELNEDLRARVASLQDAAQAEMQRADAIVRERDEALSARDAAEQSVAPLRAAKARADAELGDLRDQVHKMGLERDELSRQASAFDGIAVKARERAAEAESGHHASGARLAELEVWSAELERRLADATTALDEARAAAAHDDAERYRLTGELAEAQAQLELYEAQVATTGRLGTLTERPSAAAGVAPPSESRDVSDAELAEIGQTAVAEAHRRAERDLADAGS